MTFVEQFLSWRSRTVGTIIRGQRVDECCIEIEGDDPAPRVFLVLLFAARQLPANMTKERKLLERIFEGPTRAHTGPLTPAQAEAVLRGDAVADWRLEDEIGIGVEA